MLIWLGREKYGWPLEHHRKQDLDMRMIERFSRWDQPQARHDRQIAGNLRATRA
jgi:hypothetical protein